MNGRLALPIAVACACAGLLVGCSSDPILGTPASGSTTATTTASTSGAPGPADSGEAPTVQNPLPASVLDGNPCDSALTTEQVASFIGTTKAPQRSDIATGPQCTWFSVDGVSGQISVYYNTKAGGGLNATYRNVRPDADRWEPMTLQGYPAVATAQKGLSQSTTGACNAFVGISNDLTFGVGLVLGDNARERGVDSCAGVQKVANAVLTNLKGRS